MKFIDTATSQEHRFSIGQELASGRYYLSIPVSTPRYDDEEYYEISRETHDGYPGNLHDLIAFAQQCRTRGNDHLLLIQPGPERGTP